MTGAQIHGKKLLKVTIQNRPENLVILRRKNSTGLFDAHPLVERFNAENGTNLTVISHKVADLALTVGNIRRGLPVSPVDVSIAYEMPRRKLRKEVVFDAEDESKVVLATGKYEGERNVALVAQRLTTADFKKDGDSVILDIPDSRLVVVPNFPRSEGWYVPDPESGVPHGKQVTYSNDARYLYRRDSSYVGLLVRGYECFIGYSRQDVGLVYSSFDRFGVVAEVPNEDVPKIQSLFDSQQSMKGPETQRSVLARFKHLEIPPEVKD